MSPHNHSNNNDMAPHAFARPKTFPASHHNHQQQAQSQRRSSISSHGSDGEWSDPAGYRILLTDEGYGDNENDDDVEEEEEEELTFTHAKEQDIDSDGVAIPEFLQPLLGLSMLPYLPEEEQRDGIIRMEEDKPTSSSFDANAASSLDRRASQTRNASDSSPTSVADPPPHEVGTPGNNHSEDQGQRRNHFWSSGKRIFSTTSTTSIDPEPPQPPQETQPQDSDELGIHNNHSNRLRTPRSGGRRVRKLFASQAAANSSTTGASPRSSPRTSERKRVLAKGPIRARLQKMQEKRRHNHNNNQRQISQHSSDADEEASAPHEHPPPQFLGDHSPSSNSLLSEEAPLSKQARELNELRRQAKAIGVRASNIEERVTQLQSQAEALQQAFVRTTSELREETQNLQQTRTELEKVEEKAMAALEKFQLALDAAGLANSSAEMEIRNQPNNSWELEDDNAGAPSPATSVELLVAELANPLGEPLLPRSRAPTADEAMLALSKASSSSLEEPYLQRRSSSWNQQHADDYFSSAAADDSHVPPPQQPPPTPMRERSYTAPAVSPSRAQQLHSKKPPKHDGTTAAATLQAAVVEPDLTTEVPSEATTTPAGLPVSNFFIKVGDMGVDPAAEAPDHQSPCFLETLFPDNRLDHKQFFPIDHNVSLVLDRLSKFGLETATDEGDAFAATGDTQRLIKNNKSVMPRVEATADWPYAPWYDVPDKKEVLVWMRDCPGVTWPMIKARGILQTSPRQVVDFLLDSSEIKRYNKMCQGRDDVTFYQQGAGTTAEAHGFEGEAKVTRALNKPKLSPKTMETLALCYAKPLPGGAFIIVNRSVWENEVGPNKVKQPLPSDVIRSEMILGVQLLRPLDGSGSSENCSCCELTTITFVFSPSVPEFLARRLSPGSAANLIRELQQTFL